MTPSFPTPPRPDYGGFPREPPRQEAPPRPPPPPREDGPSPGWLRAAPVSRAVLAASVAMFAVEVYLGGGFAGIGSVGDRAFALLGANVPSETIQGGHLETLVTSCFLHGGIIHLLFNMMVLWQAGPLVEVVKKE